MLRKCPVCGAEISPRTLFSPGFSIEAGPVICGTCSSAISRPWKEYQWLGIMALGIGGFLNAIIDRRTLGLEGIEGLIVFEAALVLCVTVIFFIGGYYFFPIEKQVSKSAQLYEVTGNGTNPSFGDVFPGVVPKINSTRKIVTRGVVLLTWVALILYAAILLKIVKAPASFLFALIAAFLITPDIRPSQNRWRVFLITLFLLLSVILIPRNG